MNWVAELSSINTQNLWSSINTQNLCMKLVAGLSFIFKKSLLFHFTLRGQKLKLDFQQWAQWFRVHTEKGAEGQVHTEGCAEGPVLTVGCAEVLGPHGAAWRTRIQIEGGTEGRVHTEGQVHTEGCAEGLGPHRGRHIFLIHHKLILFTANS